MTETANRALSEIRLIAQRLHMMGTLAVGGDPLTDEDGEQIQKENIQINRGKLGALFLSTAEDLEAHIAIILKAMPGLA